MMGGRKQSGYMDSWRNGRGTRKVRGCRSEGLVWAVMGVGVTGARASRALGRHGRLVVGKLAHLR